MRSPPRRWAATTRWCGKARTSGRCCCSRGTERPHVPPRGMPVDEEDHGRAALLDACDGPALVGVEH
eukprot:6345484-Prymnesium_polylepis.1